MTATSDTVPLQEKRDSHFQRHWRLLRRYLRPHGGNVLRMAALLLFSIGLQLVNPQVIRYFLDTAQSGGAVRVLLLAASAFIGFGLLQQITNLAANLFSQQVSWAATNQLRADLTRHCLQLDMDFHKEHTPGELIERIDGDSNQLANFFSQFGVRVVGNGLLVLGILLLLFMENASLGVGMVLYTALTAAVLGVIQRPAATRWTAARQASAEQYGFLEERISGAEEIRAAGAEAYMLQRLKQLMGEFLEKVRAAFVVSNLTFNLTNLVYALGYAIGLGFGVYLFTQGKATIGTAYLITYYIGMLADPLQGIREQVQDFQQATASLERIQALFDLQAQVVDPPETSRRLPAGALSVEFQSVTFSYDVEDQVLKEISFSLPPGQVLGILGRTGSGKSTLSRLLFRLYDPGSGIISLDGKDIRSIRLEELRQRVGMVTQDVQLLNGSIRDNLTFFDRAYSDEQLEGVLHPMQLWEWAQALPGGLETKLSPGSLGLSAGEAQLLAFARVFLKNPGLVILDEASSRLDPLTETRMERAVERLFAGRTGVIIAHRLRTVQRADLILILENGKVAEFGPRQALAEDPSSRFFQLLQVGLEEVLA